VKLIVADTDPLNYLMQIGCVLVPRKLVDAVCLPVEVLEELKADGAPPEVRSWAHLAPGCAPSPPPDQPVSE
jgi:predicted nucleic acid-binding protein